MSTPVDDLRAQRDTLLTEARDLVRSADHDLTGDSAARFDAIETEVDNLSSLIERHEKIARLATNPDAIVSGDGATIGAPYVNRSITDPWAEKAATPTEARSLALTAIERSTAPDHAKQTATVLAERNSTAARWAQVTSDPAYLRAFYKLWNDPQRGHLEWTPEEHQAHAEVVTFQRAASLTDASGGYMVPFSLDPAIMLTSAGSVNPMRQVSRVEQTVTDSWNGVTSEGVTAAWYAEAAQVTDDAPTLAQPAIPVHRGSAFIPFSLEVGMDAIDFGRQCALLLADAKDQLEAEAFTTGAGAGSNKPKGIITAVAADAGSIVAPTTAETFASTDTYKVQEAVPARWRANARFMANLSIINKIRQFDTGGGSAQIAQLGEATPSRLLGWPLHENSTMDGAYDAAATAAHNYLLLAGDFQHYVIADRIGTTVELVPHLFGANGRPTGQRGYFMWFRTGGDCTNTDAFRLLDIPTTA